MKNSLRVIPVTLSIVLGLAFGSATSAAQTEASG